MAGTGRDADGPLRVLVVGRTRPVGERGHRLPGVDALVHALRRGGNDVVEYVVGSDPRQARLPTQADVVLVGAGCRDARTRRVVGRVRGPGTVVVVLGGARPGRADGGAGSSVVTGVLMADRRVVTGLVTPPSPAAARLHALLDDTGIDPVVEGGLPVAG